MLTTTLTEIKSFGPCQEGWENLLLGLNKTKADDELLPLSFILKNNGMRDLLWLLARINRPLLVTFSADCAERVLPIFEKEYPEDKRPRLAIEAARAWLSNPTSETNAAYAANAAAKIV